MKLIVFCAVSWFFLGAQTPLQRADASQNRPVPMRAGRLDCVGFPDHAQKLLHVACTDLSENRFAWQGDVPIPARDGDTEFIGFQRGVDRIEWRISRDVAGLKWSAASSGDGSPTASGTL